MPSNIPDNKLEISTLFVNLTVCKEGVYAIREHDMANLKVIQFSHALRKTLIS